ncbi:GW repeat- and PHD finger-containing protein NERD [Actinidia rufa]|uniref:GW repeat-and PHD finger-containing protein NERD n=1 Tax=Actinidia rufa TaxID=165716 RepID=A0A7J0F6V8_9ERIC|nr:GW repeat- and PHD finger-containing protein NERD [Actinidia rufa]
MEDDEETKNVFEPLAQEVNPLEILEVTDTEQWEFASESFPELGDLKSSVEVDEDKAVAEFEDSPLSVAKSPITVDDDSQIVGDKTPNVAGGVEAVAEEEIPTVVSEMEMGAETELLESGLGANSPVGTGGMMERMVERWPRERFLMAGTQVEMKGEVANSTEDGGGSTEGEILMTGTEEEMKCEVDDLANSSVATGDGGAVAEGGTLMAGITNTRVETGDGGGVTGGEILMAGTEVEMKCEVANSSVATGDGGAVAEGRTLMAGITNSRVETGDGGGVKGAEILMASNETEMKSEVEGVGGGVSKSVTGFDELEQVVVKSPVVEEDVVEEIAGVGNEMELGNEFEAIESSEAKFVCELGDSQQFGAESFAVKETDEDEAMEKGEMGMEDTEMESENEVANEVRMPSVPQLDNSHNVEVGTEEDTPIEDTEMEMDATVMAGEEKGVGGGGGKRRRGKKSGVLSRAPSRRVVGEDVCFICFDGGELVLCDRRGCPKAYHPSCVNRDEAFFRAKGRWNCGWHLCSICEKNAYYMCYTCTFSLCRACIKDAVILCVRGNKGFCETCMKTVMLIENNEQADKEVCAQFS